MTADATKEDSPLHGLLIVDKPRGSSSMDVVRRVRRAAGGAKTGHAGTLDPLATGVLVCCIGRATKQVASIMSLPKCYEAMIDLGAFTATDDLEGDREEIHCDSLPTRQVIDRALVGFVGDIRQVPPAYSAVHVGGQRAYARVRRGEQVVIPARTVRVDCIGIMQFNWPFLEVRIRCGKGTYIRSMARDIGTALGTGGHLMALRRTEVGQHTVREAVTMDRLKRPLTQADLLDMHVGPGAGHDEERPKDDG